MGSGNVIRVGFVFLGLFCLAGRFYGGINTNFLFIHKWGLHCDVLVDTDMLDPSGLPRYLRWI